MRAADVEALAGLVQRGARALELRGEIALADEQAELVASHAVRAAVGRDRGAEVAPETSEQRIAGRVPEAVVVGLEAVEVEQREQDGTLRRRPGGQPVEIGEQRAPVAQAGERVRRRLDLADAQRAEVLVEGQREADDGRGDRGRRQPQRELVQPLVVVVDQQAERDQREPGGDGEQPAAQPARVQPRGGPPGGERDQHVGRRPCRVEQRVVLIGAFRDLVEVDPVGHDPDRERQGQEPPDRTRGPARQDHHRDHEHEHQQVTERIGEVRRDRREGAVGAGDDAEHERRPHGGAGEAADQAVQPQRGTQAGRAGTQQQDETDVHGRVDAEIPEVRERRVGRRRVVHQRRGVVDVAGREEQQAQREHGPRQPLGSGGATRSQRADGDRQELDRVVGLLEHPRQDRRDVPEVAHDDEREAERRGNAQGSLNDRDS